tara:strand:- start:522 stop:659 length:138 start_codon:yes stop_codon:yes gene_type:complete
MNKIKNTSENDFFKNWSKKFLEFLDSTKKPDFPNKTHRRIWGIDD